MESQSLPLGRVSGFWKHDMGILKTPDQTGHAWNSLGFWEEGALRRLILLALQGGGWGAQWHPVLHQLGSRTLPLNASPPPVPQGPSNLLFNVPHGVELLSKPPAKILSAITFTKRKYYIWTSTIRHQLLISVERSVKCEVCLLKYI